jgi:hypothetical protein
VLSAVAMASSRVGVVIPETGRPGRDWIAAVDGLAGCSTLAPGWSF